VLKKTIRLACLGGALLAASSAYAQVPSGIAILVPDAASSATDPLSLPLTQAWLDAIQEEGFQVSVLRDSEFAAKASRYAGIILPDTVHPRLPSALVDAITHYVIQGGNVMLVGDFGSTDENGNFPGLPGESKPSRFSNLVGVDYNLYDELYNRPGITPVGLGPINGMESVLRKLQVPPGKSMPLTAATVVSAPTSRLTETQSQYLRCDKSNPGGTKGYDASYYHDIKLKEGDHVTNDDVVTAQYQKLSRNGFLGKKSKRNKASPVPYVPGDAPHVVSGYIYGPLNYATYLTCNLGHTPNIAETPEKCLGTGTAYDGTKLLESDEFGLVAGSRKHGLGNVLFVNLPLGHLKGQTDGMLMHGFVRYFFEENRQPGLARVPNGVPGATWNVHVDSEAALEPMRQMDRLNVWDQGPFSIHFTAGPYVDYLRQTDANGNDARDAFGNFIYLRDSEGNLIPNTNLPLGLNVPNNPASQHWIKYVYSKKHQVGAHGGWIHDYYGHNVRDDVLVTLPDGTQALNPSNEETFKPFLPLNKQAVDNVIGMSTTEYSAPTGNNPKWAVNWHEQNGIVGMYFVGHTGMGMTRHWREGMLMNPKLWMHPVMPFGLHATFEDFEANNISVEEVSDWLNKLVDFTVTSRGNRMVYFHPPGAISYISSLTGMLDRASRYKKNGQFNWYTIADMARFMADRRQVEWKATPQSNGRVFFEARHPASLKTQTWILPKSAYSKPVPARDDMVSIRGDQDNWIVIAKNKKSVRFTARTAVQSTERAWSSNDDDDDDDDD
jgi:hypothetical protein